jgi:hypothetical protein
MSGDVWIFLGLLVTAGMPVVVAIQASRARRQERRDDRAREDELAARTKAVAAQVDKAADLLVKSNATVAQAAKETKGQLLAIHTLVNSNLSSALQERLDQTRISLTLMNEIVRLNRLAGEEPNDDARASIDATKATIAELEAQLRDRLAATKAVEDQQRMKEAIET